MLEDAKLFEEASRETYKRWQSDAQYKNIAERNIELGIINALELNNYLGFTRNNSARSKVIEIGQDGIVYSLLYNMIQLAQYKFQKIGSTLGKPDAFITYVTESIKQARIEDLENMLKLGITNISNNNLSNNKSNYDEVAKEFAQATLSAYSWYNTAYHTVSTKEPISVPYYKELLAKLNNHYLAKRNMQKSHKTI